MPKCTRKSPLITLFRYKENDKFVSVLFGHLPVRNCLKNKQTVLVFKSRYFYKLREEIISFFLPQNSYRNLPQTRVQVWMQSASFGHYVIYEDDKMAEPFTWFHRIQDHHCIDECWS
jgi:hypothetical protein